MLAGNRAALGITRTTITSVIPSCKSKSTEPTWVEDHIEEEEASVPGVGIATST